MKPLINKLGDIFKGEVHTDKVTCAKYAHDASIYEMIPEAVLFPRDADDIKNLVKFVSNNKHAYPDLSITTQAAATDMTGAAIGNSLTIDMTQHFSTIHNLLDNVLHTQPGVFMRDIDPLLTDHGLMLGCVPASRFSCTIGGMVANNSGGEQSLRYGNTDRSTRELSVVFADGKEYTLKPISKRALDILIKKDTFEASIYRQVYELIEANYDLIKNARPQVNKNAMGYNLWSVWDRETDIFDLTQLITGSQGTLGVITDIKIQAIAKPKHSGLLLAYLDNLKSLGDIIPLVMSHHPATFEGFDDITFSLGIKYFNIFRERLGTKDYLKQQAALLVSVAKFKGHLPSIVLMIGFDGDSYQSVNDKIIALTDDFKSHKIHIRTEIEGNEDNSEPFWTIRRASLKLLRQRVHSKYAVAFMDDMAVQPQYIPEFFPKVRQVIRKYKLTATIAGHFGDGNFHIIPLMDITDPAELLKLEPAMRELIPIVLQYKGTLSGEHNDGMVRGPWLAAMFGDEMYTLFRNTKEIFDPFYIFNPHKKTDASWDYSMNHIRHSNDKR